MPGTGSADSAVERILRRLAQRLHEAGSDNVLGIALYGPIVQGPYTPGISDVNLLLVLADAGLKALVRLAPCLTAALRQSQVVPFVVTPAELRQAAMLFPLKVLDIQCRHRLLYGDLHLAGLQIDPAALCLRALQECKNLDLKMRQRVLERGAEPAALWGGLLATLPKLMLLLDAVLRAHGATVPEGRPELLRQAGRVLALDTPRLERLTAVRRRDPRPNDDSVRELTSDLFALLTELTHRLGLPGTPTPG